MTALTVVGGGVIFVGSVVGGLMTVAKAARERTEAVIAPLIAKHAQDCSGVDRVHRRIDELEAQRDTILQDSAATHREIRREALEAVKILGDRIEQRIGLLEQTLISALTKDRQS